MPYSPTVSRAAPVSRFTGSSRCTTTRPTIPTCTGRNAENTYGDVLARPRAALSRGIYLADRPGVLLAALRSAETHLPVRLCPHLAHQPRARKRLGRLLGSMGH